MSAVVRSMLGMVLLLAASACSRESSTGTSEPQSTAARVEPASTPSASTLSSDHACNLLEAADFAKVGLAQGHAKADKGISGTECTWDPVLGAGGFLHLQTLGAESFERRKQRALEADAKKADIGEGEMITLSGLGDEAFVQKWRRNETITVKSGDRAFHISGNARLKQSQLEPLARAVLARL